MAEEKLHFQAEVSRLLDIVANSLYSEKEVFLRELISNGSDACDRLRYAAITKPELTAADPEFGILVRIDKAAGTLSVTDNGIGMNRDDLVANLGTIARSGTAAFVEDLASKTEGSNLIGQFGVGFYAAFMVADEVEVKSRKAGEAEGWCWRSDGKGDFTIAPAEDAPPRGSAIVLKLRKDEQSFLEPARLKQVVTTYSDHIAVPIRLVEEDSEKAGEPEQINSAGALWTRPKSEISEEQYKEFYHHVSHGFDEPWLRLHFKAEGVIEYGALLYVPTARPFDLFDPARRHRVKLYVRRVFITDECADLLPPYLRFLQGVIDSEDLPLNISREMLQNNPLVAKIRSGVVKRALSALQKKAEKEPEAYAAFWDNFGAVLKEGLYEDTGQRDSLLALARFHSTAGDDLISLSGYVERMKPGQEAIYYLTGEQRERLAMSPHLEGFAAKGVEVLLLTDPVDEFWLPAVGTFQDKPLKSVTQGGAELNKIGAADSPSEEESSKEEAADDAPAGLGALIAFVKLTLKDQVKDVRASQRLTESPVCLVADEGDLDMRLERLLRQHQQLQESARRILEVNPKHPLIKCLVERVGSSGAGTELESAALLLLDQARIMEGEPLPDPAAFTRRLSELVAKGLAV